MTCIPTWAGFCYLALVPDGFSRKVAAGTMGSSKRPLPVIAALNTALRVRTPCGVIRQSNEGSQYGNTELGTGCVQAPRLACNQPMAQPAASSRRIEASSSTSVVGHDVLCHHAVMNTSLITVDPQRRGGRACVRDLRISVGDVLGWLAQGLTPAQLITEYPELTSEDIRACLSYAADRESHEVRLTATA